MDRASSSDSSADSPPHITGPEDDLILDTADSIIISDFAKDRDSIQMAMKRHHPGRPMAFGGGGEGAREPKARRKDPRGGAGSSLWDAIGTGSQVRQKDELVDAQLVEQLRSQFGDPFDDSVLKKAAGTGA